MNQRKPEEVISDFFEVTERRAGNCVKALTDAGYVIVEPSPAPEASVPCPVCGVDMIHRCGTKQGRLDA